MGVEKVQQITKELGYIMLDFIEKKGLRGPEALSAAVDGTAGIASAYILSSGATDKVIKEVSSGLADVLEKQIRKGCAYALAHPNLVADVQK